jgi:hypothetical protein
MFNSWKVSLTAALAALILLAGQTNADEKGDKDKAKSKEKALATKLGTAIVKAARAKPRDIKLLDYKFLDVKDKPNRKEIQIKMEYMGIKGTKTKFKSDITVQVDVTKKDKWEYLNIKYQDDNKRSLLSPNEKKIQALLKEFNK